MISNSKMGEGPVSKVLQCHSGKVDDMTDNTPIIMDTFLDSPFCFVNCCV